MGWKPDTIRLTVCWKQTLSMKLNAAGAVAVALIAAIAPTSPTYAGLEANPTALKAISFEPASDSPVESTLLPAFGPPTSAPVQAAATDALPSGESLPIGPARRTSKSDPSGKSEPASPSAFSSTRMGYGLALVVILIFLVRWGVKKAARRVGTMAAQLGPAGRAPSGVLSVLARYPVGRGQSLVLLKMDQRVLLLNQTPDGFRMLTEVQAPEEVASLLIKTRDEQSESLSSKFSKLLKRFERDPDFVEYDIDTNFDEAPAPPSDTVFPDTTVSRDQLGSDPLASIRRRLEQLQEAAS